MKPFCLALILTAVVLPCCAQQGIEGKWSCKSEDTTHTKLDWTLAITRSDGKLQATMQGGTTGDVLTLERVSFKDNIFNATLTINAPDDTATLNLKLNDNKLEGTFGGKNTGTGTCICESAQGSRGAEVLFEAVRDPAQELCIDDTQSRTPYINVPLVEFRDSKVSLNGKPTSESELLDWAQRKYRDLPEQALWVKVWPGSRAESERALLPVLRAQPRLHLREVPPLFTCPTGKGQ